MAISVTQCSGALTSLKERDKTQYTGLPLAKYCLQEDNELFVGPTWRCHPLLLCPPCHHLILLTVTVYASPGPISGCPGVLWKNAFRARVVSYDIIERFKGRHRGVAILLHPDPSVKHQNEPFLPQRTQPREGNPMKHCLMRENALQTLPL